MKNSEVNNKHKNNDGKLKAILSIWYFKRKIFPDRIIMKHKAILFAHRGIKKWGVDYWGTYYPVVNLIRVRFLISIAIIHSLSSIPIDCILAFTQAELYVDVFMDITLGMVVDGNRKEWVVNLNKSLYVINK